MTQVRTFIKHNLTMRRSFVHLNLRSKTDKIQVLSVKEKCVLLVKKEFAVQVRMKCAVEMHIELLLLEETCAAASIVPETIIPLPLRPAKSVTSTTIAEVEVEKLLKQQSPASCTPARVTTLHTTQAT